GVDLVVDVVDAQADQVLQVPRADFGARRGFPGHRQRVEAVVQAPHHLPGAVLPPAHRDQAVVAPAPALRLLPYGPQVPAPRFPVDLALLQLLALAARADPLLVDPDAGAGVREDAPTAVPHPPNSSTKNLLVRK